MAKQVKRLLVAAIIAAAILAAGAQAAGDPRKCGYSTSATTCTADNAFLTVRRYMSARLHLYASTSWGSGSHACKVAAPSLLMWRCTWTDGGPGGPSTGMATITFRAFANGWHARVAVLPA